MKRAIPVLLAFGIFSYSAYADYIEYLPGTICQGYHDGHDADTLYSTTGRLYNMSTSENRSFVCSAHRLESSNQYFVDSWVYVIDNNDDGRVQCVLKTQARLSSSYYYSVDTTTDGFKSETPTILEFQDVYFPSTYRGYMYCYLPMRDTGEFDIQSAIGAIKFNVE